MSTSPVTLMVARRVAHGRYEELIAWLREGEQLATDFPGYLGSGVLAPPPDGDEFQIIFRFSNRDTMHAWEHSASRSTWLVRGSGLFAQPSEHRVSGIEGWFGGAGQRPPPRWKQAVAIWLAFFPVSLVFNFVLGPLLGELNLLARVLVSTLALTPLMVFLFIPLSTHLLARWLHSAPHAPIRTSETAPGR
ncbi:MULTISPECIES: antibiotic biosynthesis monooxygenase [unclassified Pseudomonas]|uniref:antibiotic biosynthesis monooxygenase n=1 Tax=unclassified Pseudomonas TaxID=196821 RepID=UPI002AC9CEC5|nr:MULTISPECIES: antibiotic biosynthesis monooxygenase [unclassified Pseudomonas]MEB0042727.1 antibiotic biosynthesis monooxygenase [Pseudomonas sp. MH10]MEB0079913.1 antibiotic biosynthesis monooxygenase [Pseudomonas sp. MH10out]MEB0093810.1 antibiotic biosynthesis monooxygenase [Pseudomonas sp. CCI4.2]MEB0103497.1 antibiotic biosynthesis monooxygenase [Pseudomonas sp. CCI3.2]MEB0121674.1 antibiotic biosynthesis monooxygenase [Pseudomonas sp. CCI1.2]